jgi:uncharacterized cupin superfamily protein
VLVDDVGREELGLNSEILRPGKWSVEVEILDINGKP